jgi:hypothetical protein
MPLLSGSPNISSIPLLVQSSNPSGTANKWRIFAKADGVYILSPAGDEYGPLIAIGEPGVGLVTVSQTIVGAINEVAGQVVGGSTITDQQLKDWASAESYELTAATVDVNNVVTVATVKWPDGSAGVFAVTTQNTTWLAIDAYTITHVASGKTVTQAAVTRNSTGAVTAKPALTVA